MSGTDSYQAPKAFVAEPGVVEIQGWWTTSEGMLRMAVGKRPSFWSMLRGQLHTDVRSWKMWLAWTFGVVQVARGVWLHDPRTAFSGGAMLLFYFYALRSVVAGYSSDPAIQGTLREVGWHPLPGMFSAWLDTASGSVRVCGPKAILEAAKIGNDMLEGIALYDAKAQHSPVIAVYGRPRAKDETTNAPGTRDVT